MKTLLKTLCGAAVSAALLVGSAVSFGAERIVVVGDSITGHSMNLPYGFTHEIRAALAAAGIEADVVNEKANLANLYRDVVSSK